MNVPAFLSRFQRDECGAAAEFVMILPLALLFLLGIIDGGRYFYEVNKGEKATQFGARFAVVTDPVSPKLVTESYVGTTVGTVTLTQGDRIPAAALGLLTCTDTSCTCTTAPCPASPDHSPTAFNNILTRVQAIKPDVAAADLVVEYRGSGLGYAGDPNGMDIAPMTTVRLQNQTFATTFLFGTEVGLPNFSYTLTMEDGQGSTSN